MRIQRSAVALMVLALALGSSAMGGGVLGVVGTRRAPEPKTLDVLSVPALAYGDTIFSDPIYAVRYGTISVQTIAEVPDGQRLIVELHARTDPAEGFGLTKFDTDLWVNDHNKKYSVWSGISAPQVAIAIYCKDENGGDVTDISVSVYLE